MSKKCLVVAAALALGACGHRDETRVPAPLGSLVVPTSAPWLLVEAGPESLLIRGLDDRIELLPQPPLSTALEAQLRKAVQADYFNNLTIACNQVDAGLKASGDDTPDTLTLNLSVHCITNARGLVTDRIYSAAPTARVAAGSAAADYAGAFATLLQQGSQNIGVQLDADVKAAAAKLGES